MSVTTGWRPSIAELEALRGALLRSEVARLELDLGDVRLRMVLGRAEPGTAAAPAVPHDEAGPARIIASDGPGLFRAADPLGGEPLAGPGTDIAEGQIVALLQVGAALLPVTSRLSGQIEAVLAQDGEVVGYGTPLFRLSD